MTILLTGGSACGKSRFAEALAASLPGPRYYIATMRPYDEECLVKIARHQQQRRDIGFETIEKDADLEDLILPARGTALLECMCNLTANEMFDAEGNQRDVFHKILHAVEKLAAQCDNLIVVTNEVGAELGDFGEGTRAYIDTLGRLNRALTERFDCAAELVCGIPLVFKGELPCDF